MTKRDQDSPPNKLKGKITKTRIPKRKHSIFYITFLTHSTKDTPEFPNKEKELLMIEVSKEELLEQINK